MKSARRNIDIQNIAAFDALADALGNDRLRKIEAKDVAIRFAIREGRITTEPFDLKIGDVGVNLSGSTGLDQTIDYQAKVAIPGGGVLQTVGVNIGGDVHLAEDHARGEGGGRGGRDQPWSTSSSRNSRAANPLSEEIAKQADNIRAEARNAGQKLVEAAQNAAGQTRGGGREEGNAGETWRRRRPGTNWSSEAEKTGCKPRSRGRAPDRETHTAQKE